jgi:uncharacterized protein YjiK
MVVLYSARVLFAEEPCLSLTYLDRTKINDDHLDEPSGLALSHDKDSLWTVSDDTKRVFNLTLDGDLREAESFAIPVKGLEGITLDPTGAFLLVVQEGDNEIIKIRTSTEEVDDRKRLREMAGYDDVAEHFAGSGSNKGLEGICWNSGTGTLFVLKEGEPGLLLEVSSDLQTIRDHKLLGAENGFRDAETADDELDFSGICYDESRDRFWIVSDKGQRLFLYDWDEDRVVQSFPLGYGKGGKYREITKAEGVAVEPDAHRLYVVSDEEARLYIFDIRQ